MKKVAKNRYFVICAKSLLENMNSNEAEKTVKKFGARCQAAGRKENVDQKIATIG